MSSNSGTGQLIGEKPLQDNKGLNIVSRTTLHSRQNRIRRSKIINHIKSGPCADCNQFFPPICMDFDHVRGIKISTVSRLLLGAGMKDILKEIAKCDLVCSNCHRIRTKNRKAQLDQS